MQCLTMFVSFQSVILIIVCLVSLQKYPCSSLDIINRGFTRINGINTNIYSNHASVGGLIRHRRRQFLKEKSNSNSDIVSSIPFDRQTIESYARLCGLVLKSEETAVSLRLEAFSKEDMQLGHH